jgi:hypothetical protein
LSLHRHPFDCCLYVSVILLFKDGSQTLLGAQTLLQLASPTSVVNPINGNNEVSLLADVLGDISFEYDEAYVEGTADVDGGVSMVDGGVSMDDFFDDFVDNIEWADDDYDHDEADEDISLFS